MPLQLIGLNFRSADIRLLEILDREIINIRKEINSNADFFKIDGSILVSTCNRFEGYFDTTNYSKTAETFIGYLAEKTGLTQAQIQSKVYIKTDQEAIAHLFEVACGMDSMIIGESEVAGQIKRALSDSQLASETSRLLEILFQRAAFVSKKITTETGLGASGRSLVSTGIEIAMATGLNPLTSSVLLIGTGAYARVAFATLKRVGVKEISVFSSSGRGAEFGQCHGIKSIGKAEFAQVVKGVNLIVGCSGTGSSLVTSELLRNSVLEKVWALDLSLSGDIDAKVSELDHVHYIDLAEIHASAPKEHQEVTDHAALLVAEEVSRIHNELLARESDPLVRALRTHAEKLVSDERLRVARVHGEEVATIVEQSLRTVTKSIFHKPTVMAKEVAQTGEMQDYERALKLLFGLEQER